MAPFEIRATDCAGIQDAANNHLIAEFSRGDLLAAQIGIADADCGCLAPAVPHNELSRFGRVRVWIFGDRAPRPLANPRLEMVRMFFCATRAGHSASVTLMSDLQKYGLQPAHLSALASLII
jgi:hypothetical protein